MKTYRFYCIEPECPNGTSTKGRRCKWCGGRYAAAQRKRHGYKAPPRPPRQRLSDPAS